MKHFSGQQLGNHIPAATNTHEKTEERCFLCGPCREVITNTVGAMNQLSSARGAEKSLRCSSVDSSVLGYSPDSNDVSTEIEESPLLRAVTEQRLEKKLHTGEDLACSDF
jgi:hypothetical protein